MTIRWLLAALHLLAFGIAFASIQGRAWALRGPLDEGGLARALNADNVWGVSALLAIATGLPRAFGGLEKGSAFYLGSSMFWVKMGLFAVIFLLEIGPMVTLIRWRIRRGRGHVVDTSRAPLLARISFLQSVLLIAMLFAATAMARGIGY
jgi:putative membrane protein